VTIDYSGKWWVGDRPNDLDEYLRAYTVDTYPVAQFKLTACTCGEQAFRLAADADEGCASVACMACGASRFLLDSESVWGEADPVDWTCIECGEVACNVGVGLARYADDARAARWAYVGCRCVRCGILGCFAEWKLDGDPMDELLGKI
jgi:hypothetical protein